MNSILQRARFYAILDTVYVPRQKWRSTCEALIAGGAGLVQVRAKQESSTERALLLEEILPLFSAGVGRPILVVNDDVELCARTPGVGLHLGQDDTPPLEARARIGADQVLGLSTHSWAQAEAAMALPRGTISYFCIGPVFATQTKPDYQPVGLELVRRVAAARPELPWFAIGGINCENLSAVADAGAPAVVAVSAVLRSGDPARVIRDMVRCLDAAGRPALSGSTDERRSQNGPLKRV